MYVFLYGGHEHFVVRIVFLFSSPIKYERGERLLEMTCISILISIKVMIWRIIYIFQKREQDRGRNEYLGLLFDTPIRTTMQIEVAGLMKMQLVLTIHPLQMNRSLGKGLQEDAGNTHIWSARFSVYLSREKGTFTPDCAEYHKNIIYKQLTPGGVSIIDLGE